MTRSSSTNNLLPALLLNKLLSIPFHHLPVPPLLLAFFLLLPVRLLHLRLYILLLPLKLLLHLYLLHSSFPSFCPCNSPPAPSPWAPSPPTPLPWTLPPPTPLLWDPPPPALTPSDPLPPTPSPPAPPTSNHVPSSLNIPSTTISLLSTNSARDLICSYRRLYQTSAPSLLLLARPPEPDILFAAVPDLVMETAAHHPVFIQYLYMFYDVPA